MARRDFKVAVVLLILLSIILLSLYILYSKDKDYFTKTKINNVSFKNSSILVQLSKEERKQLNIDIIDYLNDKRYSLYTEVIFKKINDENNDLYIYFTINNDEETLIETIYNQGNPKFYFLGDELNTDYKSSISSRTYLQIVNPKEYQKQEELKKIRESDTSLLIDSTPNKETVIE